MDSDWTSNNCSWRMELDDAASKDACIASDWTREEDKAFENALATHYNDADIWDKIACAVPGKTIEDLKLHYEALSVDLEAIESGKVPLPDYPTKGSVLKEKKKKKSEQAQRGAPWTEEEHRQFLYGLQRFGRGDWKSISRYSVRTKSNSQVASHAQKYFKRLSSAKEGKRLSINDITTLNPEKLLAFEKATTSCMPGRCKEESTTAGTEELLPGNLEKAAVYARNQLLAECTTEASFDGENQLLPEYSNEAPSNASGKCKRPKRASSTDEKKVLLRLRYPKKSLTCNESQLLHGYPKEASSSVRNQLLPKFPEKAPTDTGNPLLLGSKSKKAPADSGKLLLPGYPNEAPEDIGHQLLRGCTKKARMDTGNQLLPGYPHQAPDDTGKLLLPTSLFGGTSDDSSFPGKAIRTDTGSQPMEATPSLGNQYPMEASVDLGKLPQAGYSKSAVGNQLLSPSLFSGSLFSGQVIEGPSFSSAMLHVCDVSSPPFAMEPVHRPGAPAGSVEMPGHPAPSDATTGFYSTDAVMQDADVALNADGQFDIGSSTEIMDLDLSLFPHFLD